MRALWFSKRTLFGVRPAIQSVAVLPLTNLSNDPEQDYFADGITEQLITDLSYAKPLFQARRYDEAIAECERLIALDPNHLSIYITYGNSLVEKGRYQEAEALFKRGQQMEAGIQAWLYARQGNAAAARKVLKENAAAPINPRTAVAHYLLGEQELALKELDYLANETWSIRTYSLRTDPCFDPMRNDPRFIAIVKKTGLFDQ